MDCNCFNPYTRCKCNSRSIQPCMFCDFTMYHDCESERSVDEVERLRIADREEEMSRGYYRK